MVATVPTPTLAELLNNLADPGYKVRKEAARHLAHFYPAQAAQPLLTLLKDRSSAIRRLAARLLADLRDHRAVEPLCELFTDKIRAVRLEAIRSVERLGSRRAVAPLIALLVDSEAEVRNSAAGALGNLGDPAAVPPLLAYLATAGCYELSVAIGALGRLADPRAVDPIVAVLKRREIIPPVPYIEVALEQIRSPQASLSLQALLVDANEHTQTRANAAWLLGRLRCYSAGQSLIETLADGDAYLRYKAVEALRVLKNRQAIEPIRALLHDEDEQVRAEAASTLEDLLAPSVFETLSSHRLDLGTQRFNKLANQLAEISAIFAALGDK